MDIKIEYPKNGFTDNQHTVNWYW